MAPSKSYNFASHPKVKRWISKIKWDHIEENIDVVTDFRYLGAHITTRDSATSSTMNDRVDKAIMQLKRLKYCQAGVQAKVKAILGKIYAGGLYGVEAAQLAPARVARLSAAVIDAFRSRNNDHNADRFYATVAQGKDEIDPVAQILCRRVMQLRRTACKREGADIKFKDTLLKYAKKVKKGEKLPKWYHEQSDRRDDDTHQYPEAQPHPSTKEHDVDWSNEIQPRGPVGLLIESLVWNGMAIDQDLRIRQKNEPDIDIMNVPYQSLKKLVLQAAARARTRAEWKRNTGNVTSNEILEIDRELSQVSPLLNDLEKGIVATSMMGGTQAKSEIAKYNEDVVKICSHCHEADSTTDHIKWTCKAFHKIREDTDPELARIPAAYLPLNVRSGVAPAMKISGKQTYWGKQLPEDTSEEVRKLLGVDLELHTPGKNADVTKAREEALSIADQDDNRHLNARQLILKYKQAHGSGMMPEYPTQQDIASTMQAHDDNYMVDVYGDGSLTDPTNWWAALGGYGIWIPAWNQAGGVEPHNEETAFHGPAIGQMGSSTRQELVAWIQVLTMPFRSRYATDSKSMMDKALKLIDAAKKEEQQIQMKQASSNSSSMASSQKRKNPFKKAWGSKLMEICGSKLGKPFSSEERQIRRYGRSRGMQLKTM